MSLVTLITFEKLLIKLSLLSRFASSLAVMMISSVAVFTMYFIFFFPFVLRGVPLSLYILYHTGYRMSIGFCKFFQFFSNFFKTGLFLVFIHCDSMSENPHKIVAIFLRRYRVGNTDTLPVGNTN